MNRPSSTLVTAAGALGLVFVLALACRYNPSFSNTLCGTSEPQCPSGFVCDEGATPPVCVSVTGSATGGRGGTAAAGSGGAAGAGGTAAGNHPGSGGIGGRSSGGAGAAGTAAAGGTGQGGVPGTGGAGGTLGSGGATASGTGGAGGKLAGGGAPGSGGASGSGGMPTTGSGGASGMSGSAGAGGVSGGSGGAGTGGAGTGGATVPACGATDTRCASTTEVQACTAGQWGMISTCPNACVGSACGGQCKPQAKQCATDTPQTCDQTGTWRDAPTGACPAGLCAAGACLTTMNYGYSTGSSESLAPANDLVAVQVQLPAGVLVGLGFVALQTTGQHLILGLYTDVSGHAGKLLQSSGQLTVAIGTNEVAVAHTTLTAGAYWLVEVSDGTTHFAGPGQTIVVGVTSYPFAPLPMNIASPLPTSQGNAPDLYARVAN
jgi:hypothetical protein